MNSRCQSGCVWGQPSEEACGNGICKFYGMSNSDLFFWGMGQEKSSKLSESDQWKYDNFPPGTIPPRSREDGE